MGNGKGFSKNGEGLGSSGQNRGQNNQAKTLGLSNEQARELWDFVRDETFDLAEIGSGYSDPKINFRKVKGQARLQKIFDVIFVKFPELNAVEFTDERKKALQDFVVKVHDAQRRNRMNREITEEKKLIRERDLKRKLGEGTEVSFSCK